MMINCGVVLVLAFAVVKIAVAAAECNPPRIVQKDVIIIGTGMAGLSAGKRIWEVDPNIDFVILERQGPERIGGRVRSNTEWFPGFIVEEGANWLVDIPGNIELTLAERYSLDTFEQDFLNFNVYEYDASNDSSQAELVDQRAWNEAYQYFATTTLNCLKRESKKVLDNFQDYDPTTDGALAVLSNQCDWFVRPEVENLDYFAKWFNLDYEIAGTRGISILLHETACVSMI